MLGTKGGGLLGWSQGSWAPAEFASHKDRVSTISIGRLPFPYQRFLPRVASFQVNSTHPIMSFYRLPLVLSLIGSVM